MPGDFPSQLGSRATGGPARGLGSGYAENQRLAGAQNPEAAARMAAMDPGQAQDLAEKEAELQGRVAEMRAELLEAVRDGSWGYPEAKPANVPDKVFLDQQPPEKIARWHRELSEVVADQHLDDVGSSARAQAVEALQIQPDDPLYVAVRDAARRKHIESQLEPIDFEQMIFQGFASQEIPLNPRLKITLSSVMTTHGLWLENYMSLLPSSNEQAMSHTFSLLQLAASLSKVGSQDVPGAIHHLTGESQKEEFLEVIKARAAWIGRLPSPLTDDFIVQYIWFSGRLRKLIVTGGVSERVGNF